MFYKENRIFILAWKLTYLFHNFNFYLYGFYKKNNMKRINEFQLSDIVIKKTY